MNILTKSKVFRWLLFLFTIIVAVLVIQILLAILKYQQNKILAPSQANTAYQQALQLCGDSGIFDLSWQDFSQGKIRSVYCN